jgi:hypothetical protein
VSYIIIANLMNESLSFMTILTKVTFVTASVASLMIHSTCFVFGLTLGTFILAHVLVKYHLSSIFYPWVVPVPDPKLHGYSAGNFFHPWVTRRVPVKIKVDCPVAQPGTG